MPRRLLFPCLVLGLAGCTHRVAPPSVTFPAEKTVVALNSRNSDADASKPIGRVTVPGEPFTRAEPAKPFTPSLVVTSQVAHADLFYASLLGVGPGFRQATRLYRGQRAYILPFAVNYAVASDRRTDLTFELSLLKADGSADGAPLHGVLSQEKVSDPRQLILPATVINYYAEPGDPLGSCRLTAHIRDNLGGDAITLTENILIADYTPPPLPPGFSAESWLESYYLDPTPELALPALASLFGQLPASRRTSALPLILAFYDQLLADNTWLLPAFTARLADADPDEAYALSVVLGFHLRAAAPEACPPAIWQRLEPFRTHAWTNPDAPLTEAVQLDSLWGRFFASGLYAPIHRLLEPLDAYDDLGATARYNTAHPQVENPDTVEDNAPQPAAPPELPPAVFREQLLRAALFSLGDNAKRHPLVRAYLELTLRSGKVAEVPRTLITRFLLPPTPAPASAAKVEGASSSLP